jgi:hypothetical protein
MWRVPITIAALCLSGCWEPAGYLSYSGEPPEDDEIWRPNPDTGPDDDDPLTGVDPVIRAADAWCYVTEDQGDWWGVHAVGDDPQGSDNLENFVGDGVTVLDDDGERVGVIALVCEPNGQCWSSASTQQLGAGCSDPRAYGFVFELEDIQGHRSETLMVQGRRGTGPNG